MTFEELREAAHEGNPEAMDAMGRLCVKHAEEMIMNGDPAEGLKAYQAAVDWFEPLAKNGYVLSGCFNWVFVQDALARIDLITGCFDPDEWIPKFQKAVEYCDFALSREQELEGRRDSMIILRNNMLMKMALAYEDLADHDSSISCSSDAVDYGCEGAKLLLGLSYFNRYLSDENGDGSDLEEAFSILRNLDFFSEAVSRSFDIPSIKERSQAKALLLLAHMYRIGVAGQNNLEKSYELLQTIVSHPWNEDVGDTVNTAQEELTHFRKGFLGGLKFVE